MQIEVQTVQHESRVHLDIAADDVEAEVKRIEKLGAKRVANVKHWVVMEAPTGQRFCVVPGGAKVSRRRPGPGTRRGAEQDVREGLLHPGSRRGAARDLGRRLCDRARLRDAERTRSDRRGA